MEAEKRIQKALETIEHYGMFDGSHHKQWVIDQVLQDLLREDYDEWVGNYNAYTGPDGETYSEWDKGIPP